MGDQGRQGSFFDNNNYSQGWRSNQHQNFGWNCKDLENNLRVEVIYFK